MRSLINIACNQARSQLPRVPADRPLEETPTSVATRHAVVLPGGLVPADLTQRFPTSVLLHFLFATKIDFMEDVDPV